MLATIDYLFVVLKKSEFLDFWPIVPDIINVNEMDSQGIHQKVPRSMYFIQVKYKVYSFIQHGSFEHWMSETELQAGQPPLEFSRGQSISHFSSSFWQLRGCVCHFLSLVKVFSMSWLQVTFHQALSLTSHIFCVLLMYVSKFHLNRGYSNYA